MSTNDMACRRVCSTYQVGVAGSSLLAQSLPGDRGIGRTERANLAVETGHVCSRSIRSPRAAR